VAGAIISSALSLNPFYKMGRFKYYRPRKKPQGVVSKVGFADSMNRDFHHSFPSDFCSLIEDIPELSNYHFSDSSAAEDIFLDVIGACSPMNPLLARFSHHAFEFLKEAYPPLPSPPQVFDHFSIVDILEVAFNLDRSKNPGFPMNFKYYTKGTVVDKFWFELFEAVCVRLIVLDIVAPYCVTPFDFYNVFASDFFGVSVKDEVLKTSKKGRLIIAEGIVHQVVEKLLYSNYDFHFKEQRYEYNSAIGVGFSISDSNILNLRFPNGAFKSDFTTFDYTIDETEMIHHALHVLYRQRIPVNSRWGRWMINLEYTMTRKFYIMPSGSVYEQLVYGAQPTGRNETANCNTYIRNERSFAATFYLNCFLSEQLLLNNPLSAGDDCLEEPHALLSQAYSDLGLSLRDSGVVQELDFCSHLWPVGQRPVGTRIVKSVFKLLSEADLDEQVAQSFIEEYGHHSLFPTYLNIISEHRPEMKIFKMNYNERILNKQNELTLVYLPLRSRRRRRALLVGPLPQGVTVRPRPRRRNNMRRRERAVGFIGPQRNPSTLARAPIKPSSGYSAKLGAIQRGGYKEGVRHSIAEKICSLTDPFCNLAKGSRWLDGQSTGTVPMQIRSLVTVQGGTAGNTSGSYMQVIGDLPYGYINHTSYSAPNWTLANAQGDSTGGSVVASYAQAFRMVSWGVIVRNIATASNACGQIIIRKLATPYGVNSVVAAGSVLGTETQISALFPGQEITVVAKPIGTLSREFNSQNTTTTVVSGSNWEAIQIEVVGGYTGAQYVCEIVYNIEMQMVDAYKQFAEILPPAPAANTKLTDAASKVMSNATTIFEGGVEKIGGKILERAEGWLMSGAEDVMALLSI